MEKLPILISIPHGGDQIPIEVSDRVCLTPKDLFEDSDSFSREIYGIKEDVLELVETDIARAFIDLNREISDRPPKNPDGIVKTQTCHGKPIFYPNHIPDTTLSSQLIDKFYIPYHQKIKTCLESRSEILLALDCHTMESVGPAISPDQGKHRPLICLGNVDGKSCSNEWVERLAECIRESFQLKKEDVKINQPFAGGYITQKYGNHPIPWIQVEMNRSLYLSEPWFDKNALNVNSNRLKELKTNFKRGLKSFSATI
jgi:formiminoglutamase